MKWLVRALTPRLLTVALLGVPMALGLLYLSVFAADRYVSEATVAVRSAGGERGLSLPGAAALLGGLGSPSREDTLFLREYLHSLALLRQLDVRLGLRRHFEAERRDPVFRLWPGTSQEWFAEYFRNRVELSFDESSALLDVRVQAFDADFAQRLNAALMEAAEQFVNEFSQRMAREQMAYAEGELRKAEQRLADAKGKVLAFQGRHKLLDPLAQAQASNAISNDLQAALTKQEAELKNALTYLNDESYPVKALRNQVQATRAQLDTERLRGTSGGARGDRLNQLAAQYQDLTLLAGFAEDAYKLTRAAVETARVEAGRKQKSLVVVEPPSRPQTAIYPERLYDLATLFVACCLLYAVVRLAVATIQDHQD
jgi:capsular polysaccharide transport system permease protein